MQKLKKSSKDKMLLGICGGVAEFFGISSIIIRLIFIFTSPTSIIVYLILAATLEKDNKLY
ncbi:PspC domain-containing protein [Lysinibacillus agricola]|uniref:PspC domain-containing protein n=1 Tax=Lysinibacillus agricola TaxID=2590012 RepID=A0ABX7ANS6_9BACI|nr:MULTISPECIES: PspC domain-containing protein [Lysinibacillus]KOS61032.1 phage-shock protein [Lysinibacillus sp. FJAT-14222]QQP11414.1 PspC domain-containing protein [Lysinibacillus agricola]